MGRLRLKTKLVLAITGMVLVLVALFCYVYISHLLQRSTFEASARAIFVAKEIEQAARKATLIAPEKLEVDIRDPRQIQDALKDRLQEDDSLNSLLQTIVAFSYTIVDACITDIDGRAIVHTDNAKVGMQIEPREDYASLQAATFLRQLQIIYGPARVYDVHIPINRGGDQPFGDIRVGVSTVFLQNELAPLLARALEYSAAAVLLSLALAAIVSNLVLRPLEAIGRRLDLMTAEVPDAHPQPDLRRVDEFGVVNTKIERLGRQIRDVKEVFTTLKGNVDQVMGSLQEGVVLFTNENRVVLVSASAERFVAMPREEILGKPVQAIFTDASKLGSIVLDAFALHQVITQREIELENGRRVQIALDFIAERGQKIGALLTMRDTESVRRLENELEVSQRIAAIGRLTSGVAHEVKNPINAIVVHLELLREKLRNPDADSSRHMQIIENEIRRLDRVVKALVDFNRPMEPRFVMVDMRKLVDDVTMLASPDAARCGVTIESQMGADPLRVKADYDLMKHALLNIVLNGVQSMEKGGTLSLRALQGDGSVTIEVRDQGRGIPPEIQDKVFKLFFTTKQGGSGIGLAMSYRVLQFHNGSLSFESKPDIGTTFRMTLPYAKTEVTEKKEVMTTT